MPKQNDEPTLYFDVPPVKVEVYCSVGFRDGTKKLYHSLGSKHSCHFGTINELIVRFARGDRLSTTAFRQEAIGYAFRSGRVRFYGVYSKERAGTFVLSHAIAKAKDKLDQADIDAMSSCLKSFDSWAKARKVS